MGLNSGGLIIGRIFAFEIWGAYFWEGLFLYAKEYSGTLVCGNVETHAKDIRCNHNPHNQSWHHTHVGDGHGLKLECALFFLI